VAEVLLEAGASLSTVNNQVIKPSVKLIKSNILETKIPSPTGLGNFSSLDWYFSQILLPNMI
jgi:hypothetical protein